MEEGDRSVEQSIEAEAQGEAPALQNINGSATPAPPMPQFPTQFAQHIAALFQQMAGNMPTQTLIQAPTVQHQFPARQ